MKLKGVRKLVFGSVGILALLLGLGLCAASPPIAVAYPAFAAAAVSIVLAVVAGNVGEHVASAKGAQA